jgi:hypothetical protein
MDQEIVVYIHNGVLLSHKELEDIMLSEVSQDQKHKNCMFLSYMEDRSKDKHPHKNKHNNIQTQIKNMFVIVVFLYRTWEKRERNRKC